MDKTRRWLGLMRDIRPQSEEMITAIRSDDRDGAIIAWLTKQLANARSDIADFRRSHVRIERLIRKEAAALDRLLAAMEVDGDVDWSWDIDTQILTRDEAVEVEWYEDQIRGHLGTISYWRRKLRIARDIAGIELLPVHRKYHSDDSTE